MAKQKNLRSQLVHAINSNFKEGTDRHSYVEQNGRDQADIIFSYSSKFGLKDVAVNFSNYMKSEHPEVKMLADIESEHVQGFLNSKADHCTQRSVVAYEAAMRKLETLANKTYESCNLNYSEQVVVPYTATSKAKDRGVQAQIPREDYDKILERAKESESQSAYAVRLQEHLCVRVEEIVSIGKEDVDLEKGTIFLDNCKGGRPLTRELNQEAIELVKQILEKDFSGKDLFNIESDSVNKYLRETEDSLGLERHSFHDIRRTLAQEHFDELREQGYTIQEAADETSVYLNHNKDRLALLKGSYIVLR